jgi:cystathionine beta-lyase/cystathionine gamma-synthase
VDTVAHPALLLRCPSGPNYQAILLATPRRAFDEDPFDGERRGGPVEKLAALEGAEDAVVGASGMGACATALLSVLRSGDHCVAAEDLFIITRFPEGRDEVELVRYPGLESLPQHDLARRLLRGGFGGMLSFRLRGGREAMNAFADALRLCAIAVSLGDVRTLVYPMPRRNDLVRVSVGCEDVEDVVADFTHALERSAG